jgi:hypothetical protein
MAGNTDSNRRGYFRMKYPVAERPVVRYKGRDCRVSEISERGIKILRGLECSARPGQHFAGVVRFRDGEAVSIVGVVLRFDDEEMVVELTRGISLGRMTSEQRRIRKKYPMFFNEV